MTGIVKNANVSCHPKLGALSTQCLNNQSVLLSPYTGPSRFGNHKKDSSNFFSDAKFKNDLNIFNKCNIWTNVMIVILVITYIMQ